MMKKVTLLLPVLVVLLFMEIKGLKRIVKMMKKVTLLLPVLVVLLFMEIKGKPLIEANESVDPNNPESSRILPKADWLNFHNTWTLPSLPSVMSFFHNKDKTSKEAGLMKTRIEALEQSQKYIINMLKKITQDINSNSSSYVNKKPNIMLPEKHNKEEPILPAKPENNEKDNATVTENPVINENPTTQKSVEIRKSPIDDKKNDDNSAIKEILKETATKSEDVSAASEGNGDKFKSDVKDTNENIVLQDSVPISQSENQMNGRMRFID